MKPTRILLLLLLISGCRGGAVDEVRRGDPEAAAGVEDAEKQQPVSPVEALGPAASRVAIRGDTLLIRPDTGSVVTLVNQRDEGDSFILYTPLRYEAALNGFVVQIHYYEGGDYLLVDRRGGRSTLLDSEPIISPDGERFITASMDLEAEYDPTRLRIYRITTEGPVLEWTAEPAGTDMWGPTEPRWANSTTVQFKRNVPDYTRGISYTAHPATARLLNGEWFLEWK